MKCWPKFEPNRKPSGTRNQLRSTSRPMGAEDTALAVTDAHPLIWMAAGKSKRLGRAARRLFERAEAGECSIYIPATALVELGEAYYKSAAICRRLIRDVGAGSFRKRQVPRG